MRPAVVLLVGGLLLWLVVTGRATGVWDALVSASPNAGSSPPEPTGPAQSGTGPSTGPDPGAAGSPGLPGDTGVPPRSEAPPGSIPVGASGAGYYPSGSASAGGQPGRGVIVTPRGSTPNPYPAPYDNSHPPPGLPVIKPIPIQQPPKEHINSTYQSGSRY